MGINSLVGRVALVTGGATGLGLATVQRLAAAGLKGIVTLDKSSTVESPIKFTNSTDGAGHEHLRGDIREETDVSNAISTCLSRWKRLDYVVGTAGVSQAFQFYQHSTERSYTLDTFKEQLDINTAGTFNVARLAAEAMSKNEPLEEGDEFRGVIINVSCISTFDGVEGQTGYASSKGGINSMALTIARDLAPLRIRCVTIAPGMFDTKILQALPSVVSDMLSDLTQAPKRLGHPDEFAHLVQTILENPMINGTTIRLDGGLRMQIP